MKSDQKEELYGLEHQEVLVESLDEIMEQLMVDHCEEIGESGEVILERIEFPVKVEVYKRQTLGTSKSIGNFIVEEAVLWLDENHRLAADEGHDITPKMIEAAIAFAKVLIEEYKPYDCDHTGEIIMITKEMMEEWI